MNNRTNQIDLVKLFFYLLKRVWIVILCAVIGFGGMYWYTERDRVDTYTAKGTMYVVNGNPNLVNYQYTNVSDLNTAVQLLDTYMVVVRSNKVMDVVVERLTPDYPGITAAYISGSLSMQSVSETGVLEVRCRTADPRLSADICNAVLDVAPSEIIRVVSAGSIEVIDYATVPLHPDSRSLMRRAMMGALVGMVAAGAVLTLLFLLNRKITDAKDLTDNYTPPVLSMVKRRKENGKDAGEFLLTNKSSMEAIESYAKLRMNLLYTLVGKEHHSVVITSAISGEGKSTIAANLAISCAMSGKKVLLIDADLRRACQRDIFNYSKKLPGLSDVLVGNCEWPEAVMETEWDSLSILPAGHLPPNPAELLGTEVMASLLMDMENHYDLVLLDAPPVNIVSDPLVLSAHVAGCLFIVRQNFTDHREVKRALISAEMTGMEVLGFVFYGENLNQPGYYYSKKYYKNYYHKYDNRRRAGMDGRTKNKDGGDDENV